MFKVTYIHPLFSIEGLYTHNKYPWMVQTTDVTIPQISIEVNVGGLRLTMLKKTDHW